MSKQQKRINAVRDPIDHDMIELDKHHVPQGFSERFAYAFVKFLRFFADTFFAQRYGHRAVVLETVAGKGASDNFLRGRRCLP